MQKSTLVATMFRLSPLLPLKKHKSFSFRSIYFVTTAFILLAYFSLSLNATIFLLFEYNTTYNKQTVVVHITFEHIRFIFLICFIYT